MKAPVTKFFLLAGFWLMGIATTAFFATLAYAFFIPKDIWPEFLTSPAYGWVMGLAFAGGFGLSVLCLFWLFVRWIGTISPHKRLLVAGSSLLVVTAGVTFLACLLMGGTDPYTFGYFVEFPVMTWLFLVPLLGLLIGGALTLAGLRTYITYRRKDRIDPKLETDG